MNHWSHISLSSLLITAYRTSKFVHCFWHSLFSVTLGVKFPVEAVLLV